MANILQFLNKNKKEARRLFGERELKIIEKKLEGVNLTQSEKNRLSRDIREKLKFIKDLSRFENEFDLKKGDVIKGLVNEVIEVIKEDVLFRNIKEIWLFGSTVENARTFRSDIDIAVHFKNKLTKKEAFKFRVRVAGRISDKVDIQVFEFLPEKVQKSILKNHKIIWKNE